MDLREELAKAGAKFDGHVTNGSLDEQMKVIQNWFAYPEKYVVQPKKSVMTFVQEENS